jgi:hypothetical protein
MNTYYIYIYIFASATKNINDFSNNNNNNIKGAIESKMNYANSCFCLT